jgi:Protein of unknown function (DUF1566)
MEDQAMSQIACTATARVRRSLSPLVLGTLTVGALLVGARATHAGSAAERCLQDRYKAAAKYAACQQLALSKFFGGGSFGQFQAGAGKCRDKYAAAWARLQAKAFGTGTMCDAARFADRGMTVTDHLTGLEWEKKTTDATVHDTFATYSWSAADTAADGTAFTIFLAELNDDAGCFAGQCDWRLPTVLELQAICGPDTPCLDPKLEPALIGGNYWSATSNAADPTAAWHVGFSEGLVHFQSKRNLLFVRAVRGGL